MSSRVRIFDRLVGLETEYAIVTPPGVEPREGTGDQSTSRLRCYRALIDALARRIPIADAQHFKSGVFTANSSAVWFEAERLAIDTGLIEGATPECRGPLEAVIYQQAQDRLLAECAADANVPGGFQLLKNDRDAYGNTYGAQENYEATIASGWRLAVWRIGLVLLLAPALLSWSAMLVLLGLLVAYFAFASLAAFLARRITLRRTILESWLINPAWLDGGEVGTPVPPWVERGLLHALNACLIPLSVPLALLIHGVAFVPQRRALTAFLVSRAVFAGAGSLQRDDSFQLADKALAIRTLVGFGEYLFPKPIFNFGHFLKSYGIEISYAPREFVELFARRQRLQIGLGDSNMAPSAELLRVATTALVLDMVESGEVSDSNWPRLRRPLRALRTICEDPSLSTTVALRDGRTLTAVEIQREYARRAAEFLANHVEAPEEARFVCRQWHAILDTLEENPSTLVGRVDWITKRFLLEQAGYGLDWEARKKIDLRYHELSPAGYYRRLEALGHVPSWIDDTQVERAMRSPPSDSPATMRGHFIREFAVGDQTVRVNWRKVTIGRGRQRRVIRLSRYRRALKLDD